MCKKQCGFYTSTSLHKVNPGTQSVIIFQAYFLFQHPHRFTLEKCWCLQTSPALQPFKAPRQTGSMGVAWACSLWSMLGASNSQQPRSWAQTPANIALECPRSADGVHGWATSGWGTIVVKPLDFFFNTLVNVFALWAVTVWSRAWL